MGRHAKPKARGAGAKRLLARATAVATFATGGMLAQVNTASGHNGHIHVAGTNGYGGLALRSEPNTSAQVHQRLSDGQGDNISFLCTREGEQVDGLLSTNRWAKVWAPRPDGTPQEGYISLAYTDLLQSELGDMWGSWQIPDCEGGVIDHLPGVESKTVDGVGAIYYDRDAAVQWALANATQGEPPWGGCSWFVSQALWNGGLPQSWSWNRKGFRLSDDYFPWVRGTENARIANELFEYLSGGTFAAQVQELRGDVEFRQNSLPLARVGDVIAYDWDSDGAIDHMTLVTRIASDSYPEVSEWGTDTDQTQTHHATRGWTWSNTNSSWLQVRHPKVKGYLIHFEL